MRRGRNGSERLTGLTDGCLPAPEFPEREALAANCGPKEAHRHCDLPGCSPPHPDRMLKVGEMCVCDLAAAVEVPETSVSQALAFAVHPRRYLAATAVMAA